MSKSSYKRGVWKQVRVLPEQRVRHHRGVLGLLGLGGPGRSGAAGEQVEVTDPGERRRDSAGDGALLLDHDIRVW